MICWNARCKTVATAFTEAQRKQLGLLGLLPPNVETLSEQVRRSYAAYQGRTRLTDNRKADYGEDSDCRLPLLQSFTGGR